MKIYRKLFCFLLLMPVGVFYSCEEDKLMEESIDQLFRPASLTANVDINKVTLTWVPTGDAYLLELSRDNLLFERDLQSISIEGTETKYVFDDLWSDSMYSFRIKALSKDELIKDSEFNQGTFITGTENIFYGVSVGDIQNNSVLLKWNMIKEVTKIVVSAAGSSDRTIALTSSDKLAGQKLIDGLDAGTNYTFKIYNGDMLRGTISINTNS